MTESDTQRALKAALAVLDDSIKRRQDEIEMHLAEIISREADIGALAVKTQQWLLGGTERDSQASILTREEPAAK